MREIEHSDRPANIIGIDLGATEVRVARFNEGGRPEITNNAEGSDVTPAVIQIEEDGAVIIGTEAKKFLVTGTANVFTEFKREMGTDKSWTIGSKPDSNWITEGVNGEPAELWVTSALPDWLKRATHVLLVPRSIPMMLAGRSLCSISRMAHSAWRLSWVFLPVLISCRMHSIMPLAS